MRAFHIILTIPPAQAAWKFDAPSFFIGVVVTLIIVGLVYLFRQPLRDGLRVTGERLRELRERLTAGAESRYLDALKVRLAELHLAESSVAFDDIYLPPQFDPPQPRPTLTPNLDAQPPVSLTQALSATWRLAVLGPSGSGRTALLVYLANIYGAHETHDTLHFDERRLPILFHLAEIDWEAERQAEEDNPAAALVSAAIVHAPGLIAANLTSLIKNKLRSKGLVLLIDGWDELTQDDRDTAHTWLASLLDHTPDHRIVIAGSPATFGPLGDLGFAGLSIGPLQPREIQTLAGRWATAAGGGTSDAAMLAESLRQPPGTSPLPIDIAIAASVWHTRGSIPLNTLTSYDRWIDIALGDAGVTDTLSARSVLAQLAWTLFEDDRWIAARGEVAALASGVTPTKSGASIGALSDSALFVPLGQGLAFAHRRIAAYLAATYARDTGQTMALAARLVDPAWEDVAYFFAGLGDAAPLVNTALSVPDDLFRTTLTRLGRWASVAPLDAAWRSRVMGELVRVMMSPDTPGPLREQVMHAVVSTRDKGLPYLCKQMIGRPEPHFRELGLRSMGLMRREADAPFVNNSISDPDPNVRAAALRALGDIGGQAAVDALAQALLETDDADRRIAAESLALCGKGGWDLLKEGAGLPDDQGADVVRVRRAAAFGLARVDQAWARELLEKVAHADPQWAVRSSATEALESIHTDGGEIDLTPLDVDNLGWLVQWAASNGQPIGLGKSAQQALLRALEDPDPKIRLAAINTYAYLGEADVIPMLRSHLKDETPFVREAVYHALEEIARRRGEIVPI